MSFHGFWIIGFFVILQENDDVFELDIYLFSCVCILPARSVETSLLRNLNL